jgi:hypothetical protein
VERRDWGRGCGGQDLDVGFESGGVGLREESQCFESAGCEIGCVIEICLQIRIEYKGWTRVTYL